VSTALTNSASVVVAVGAWTIWRTTGILWVPTSIIKPNGIAGKASPA
jgi:hypothetical protein